jgi:hypothetical protein
MAECWCRRKFGLYLFEFLELFAAKSNFSASFVYNLATQSGAATTSSRCSAKFMYKLRAAAAAGSEYLEFCKYFDEGYFVWWHPSDAVGLEQRKLDHGNDR